MAETVPTFYKNPSVATILSFFFMGLGQIYNGQIGKGIAFIVAYIISILLMFAIIGFLTTPVLWIWGMVDANVSANQINNELAGVAPSVEHGGVAPYVPRAARVASQEPGATSTSEARVAAGYCTQCGTAKSSGPFCSNCGFRFG